MDRLLVLTAQVAIAHGHRIEVTEQTDPLTDEPVVLAIVDLDTGIRCRRAEDPSGDFSRWIGRVLRCTVTMGGAGAHTSLLVDPIGPVRPAPRSLSVKPTQPPTPRRPRRTAGVEPTVLPWRSPSDSGESGRPSSAEVPGPMRETGAKILEPIGEHVDHALRRSLQDAADDECR